MTTLQIRIDEEIKSKAKLILDALGLDLSTAIKLFLIKVIHVKGIPFTIITENGMTLKQELSILKASDEAKRGINVTGPMEAVEAIAYLKKLRLKSKKKRSKKK